jgi:hypothetical protein
MPWSVAACLLLCSGYFIYRNHVLRILYPNLEDHSPGVDWYWPHVVHSFNEVLAVLLAVIAVIIAGIALVRRRMRRRPFQDLQKAASNA